MVLEEQHRSDDDVGLRDVGMAVDDAVMAVRRLGVEDRMAVLWDAGVNSGRLTSPSPRGRWTSGRR